MPTFDEIADAARAESLRANYVAAKPSEPARVPTREQVAQVLFAEFGDHRSLFYVEQWVKSADAILRLFAAERPASEPHATRGDTA